MYFAGSNGGALRREGLYSSNLTTWRRQRKQGDLEALPKTSWPKGKKLDPSARRIAELEGENNNLKQKLKQAETIIDVQKNSRNTSEATGFNRREDMMHAAESLAHNVHVKKACKALGIPRASYYYYQKCKKDLACKRVSLTPPLALSEQEQQAVLDILHSERFLDRARMRFMQRCLMKEPT